MATEITMPQLGESVTEGTITKWLVKPGDKVSKYDPLAEVMTDKVNAEVPSSFTGTITELIAEEDQTVEVGQVICTMETEGSGEPKPEAPGPGEKQPKQEAATSAESDTSQQGRYSPAVMRLAQEHQIELSNVQGSGRGGRITRKDIQKLIDDGVQAETKEASRPAQEESTAPKSAPKQESAPPSSDARREEVPVTGVRRAIASNMVQSKHTAPHAWMMVEVDVTNMVNLREQKKAEFQAQEGFKLTFMPFFMKAVTDALKKYPQVNAAWAEDKIYRYKDVHLSMAVATEEELYVPVIRNADEKNIKGLARELNDIAGKVRSGKLTSQDMQGGTFTLNNTGSFGSVQSQPIINTPQAAILSVESIIKRPVVVEKDAIAIRHMVNLCMSLDHRVLDGYICGKFMEEVKKTLENMNETTSIY
ncbi:dihydrolipoamide acetyltransferase family protein [Alkalicoccus luteus]|uniref:Dihydrolipoamide acetyltransferase component of pyruvate dehydrogenase complex n=1 Tax=Alkalicoccus luteus TaxID=1237094 RepID=A0A969PNT3_9BACI|nr:dihydrolipoamide acetyltransferase family protein [Alkalicoccus luteus]NJP37616.1 2-oxo acid dehydrogenase subunit E2 [Alkalicoccus luteus]